MNEAFDTQPWPGIAYLREFLFVSPFEVDSQSTWSFGEGTCAPTFSAARESPGTWLGTL